MWSSSGTWWSFKIRPLNQVSVYLQGHKFGTSAMVFFISYWTIFVPYLAWSLPRVTFFFTVTSSLFITQVLTHLITWEIKEDCSGWQLLPYWAFLRARKSLRKSDNLFLWVLAWPQSSQKDDVWTPFYFELMNILRRFLTYRLSRLT